MFYVFLTFVNTLQAENFLMLAPCVHKSVADVTWSRFLFHSWHCPKLPWERGHRETD